MKKFEEKIMMSNIDSANGGEGDLSSQENINENNNVERIQVSSDQLEKLRKDIKSAYSSFSHSQRVSFFNELNNFAHLLLSKFGKEIRKNPLFHIIIGSTLSKDEKERFIKDGYLEDYSGEFSIIDFVRKLIKKIKHE